MSDPFPKRECAKRNFKQLLILESSETKYEGWNFNSGNYLFTTDTK